MRGKIRNENQRKKKIIIIIRSEMYKESERKRPMQETNEEKNEIRN